MSRVLSRARRLAGRARRELFPGAAEKAWRHAVRRAEEVPRYTPGTIELAGLRLRYADILSLCPQWHDLFVHESLRFDAGRPDPRILDGGANVGLASLYWKRIYPAARITAFEADPAIAELLRANLAANGAGDVEVVQAALWTETGTVSFHAEGSDSGAVESLAGSAGGALRAGAQKVEVPSVRLRDLLSEEGLGEHGPVDLLKLDIEGAEEEVLMDAADQLGAVRALVMEIHETDPDRRRTPALLELLAGTGFRYSLDELHPLDAPAAKGSASPFPDAPPRWVIRARAWRPGSPSPEQGPGPRPSELQPGQGGAR